MIVRGTVHNGQITLENATFPEGTQVLITPIHSPVAGGAAGDSMNELRSQIQRIATLACENDSNDGFTGADHDKVLYGNES